jgi:hypothetical protein
MGSDAKAWFKKKKEIGWEDTDMTKLVTVIEYFETI